MNETIQTNLVGKEVIFAEHATLPFIGLKAEIVVVRVCDEELNLTLDLVLRIHLSDRGNSHLNGDFISHVNPSELRFL